MNAVSVSPWSPTAVCPHASSTYLENLRNQAKTYAADHQRRGHIPFQVDRTLLVIHDDFGEVWYSEGDISFLPDNHGEYQQRQQAVWDLEMDEPQGTLHIAGREATVFPLYVSGARFTFTVFGDVHRKE
jgi:hypothetical protein